MLRIMKKVSELQLELSKYMKEIRVLYSTYKKIFINLKFKLLYRNFIYIAVF